MLELSAGAFSLGTCLMVFGESVDVSLGVCREAFKLSPVLDSRFDLSFGSGGLIIPVSRTYLDIKSQFCFFLKITKMQFVKNENGGTKFEIRLDFRKNCLN